MSTKTFDALPSWNDVESSPSFQAAEPKAREQAFALWQKDFVDTALEDPDNVSFEGWTQFKEKSKKKMRELRGASGFLTATEEADDEVASEVPDRLQLASRKRALESKASTLFGNVDTTFLAPEERDELEQLRGSLSAADDDDLDAVEEVANDDREFYVANGQFYASPSLVLAKDRYRQAVKDAPLTVEQKVEALMKGKPLREEVGARLRGEIVNMEEAFEDSIMGTDKFREFEKDYRENVDENATDADLMERWQKDNGAWYSNLGTQLKLGALRGASDTIGAYYGIKRLVGMEDEETVARAEAAGTLSQDLATATKATGGATLASDAASMIYSSLATAPAGLAGRGVVAAGRAATGVASRVAAAATAGRIGAGAFAKAATLKAGSAAGASLAARQAAEKIITRQLAVSKAGGLAASSFAAGLQSAGGAFNQYFDQFLKEELSGIPEEGRTPEVVEAARRRARDGARARALVSGLVTGAITAGFGATGAEKLAAPQVSQAAQAAKAGMFAFLAKSLGKEALSEASEEGLDTLVNGIIDKAAIDPSKPISEIVSDTMKAAVAGGLLGAGMSAPFAIADAYEARKQAKADPAIQARLNAADALGNAGATVSAGVLRQQTEAEIQANLDRQAEEATKTAEVALNEQQPVYRQATELAREVQGQLETLPPDDPQRDVLQQRLDELRLAASENPDAMVRVLDTEVGAAATVEAADPFSAPGEAPPQVAATPTTESPAAPPAEPTDATVGLQPTPGGVGTPPAEALAFTPAEGEQVFKTAKGSEYILHSDGTTTRNKAARPEHPGEKGVQPRSSRTIFVSEEGMDALGIVQSEGIKFNIEQMSDGRWAARAIDGPAKGKFYGTSITEASGTPAAGLIPVEIWNQEGRPQAVHFGNKITEVGAPAPATLAAPFKAPPVAAPTPMSPAPKAPKKPAPTQTNDTETKEPPASSVPPVTGQPPVQAPEGQTETGAAPRAGQGKPAKGSKLTRAEAQKQAAALVGRLSETFPAAAEPTPAPAVAPTQQEQNLAAVEKLIIEEMLSSGVIPSKATINTRFKAELGKGLDNGSAELVNIVNRVNDAWKKAHPPEGGTPDGNLYNSTKGRPTKVKANTSEKTIRDGGGLVPFKVVNDVEVGFFTNDPVITAKQIDAGLKVTVPANLRGKVPETINFDASTGEVISAYDRSRGAMDPPAISAKGEWYAFYKSSPKTQKRVEALSKRGRDLIEAGKTVESIADELTTATNLVNAVLSGSRKMTNEELEQIVEEKAELLRDFMAVFNIQSPRVPLIGTPAYQAAYAPDTVPGDNELIKAYLNIGGTAKTMTMVEAAVESAISAGGKFPWLGYHARDLVPYMEGAVINAALVEVRRKLLANPGVTDPETLLPKLQPFNVLVSDTLKYFSDKAKTYQSLVTTSLNDDLNDVDQVIAGVSMATAKIDAEAQAAALSKAEAASVPLTEQELASLRRIALNLDNEEKGPSYVNLKDRPLQARQAIDADLKKLPFKVGVNGLILFEYGPELKSDEKKALVTVFPGDTTEAAETRDKHSRMPDLARFFIAATALGRRALANVKNEFGKTMFPAEELSKMSAEAIFKALNTNGGAVATIVNEAKKNIGSFADTGSKTSRELNELIGGMLSSGKPPTAVRSTVTVTGGDLAKQRKQEDVATKQVVSETAPGLVGTIIQQLNQLADKAKSLSEKIDELEGAVSSFEGKPSDLSELKERLKKAKSSLASNTRATADTNAALREARTNLVTAQNNYNAVAKKNPPTTEQVVKARAEVAEAVQKVTEESVNNRISQGSPAPTISVNAGMAMTPETPQPSNTPEERAEFRNQLIAIGVDTSPDINGVIKALNLLATRGGTGSPHFKALALMFTNKGSLLNGINSVQLIEEVALAEDVSVNNGTLTFNLSAMTPTLDGTPRGPEALLRGLITHAAKTLTDSAAVLTTDQRAALESLESLRQEVKDTVEPGGRAAGLSPRFTSALTDVPSFIEAMLTSPEFAEMLQTHQTTIKSPGLTSLWGRFWSAVGKLLTGKAVAKGSALHVGLMNAGKLMVNSPNEGKRFLDALRAIIDNPEVAFPKSRTPDATEIVHQQDVNEAVELADAPTTLDKVEDRLNGDDSEAADPENVGELNDALMPEGAMLGNSVPDPKGRLAEPPTAGRVTFVPRVAPQPPVGSETLTEQQAFAGLADAIRTVDLVDKVARGVLSADEAGSSVMPSAIQAALDKITTAIERLKGSPATNKDQFIALLEDMQAFLQLEQEQIVAPPAKFDDMSSLVQDIEVEALPPESEIPLAEVAEDEVPFTEPYIETEVEDGSKKPLDFGPFLRSATVKTGRRVAMVDAGPGIPEQPLYVRHDRSDTTIYMNKSAMTALVEKLRASGYSTKDMTAYLNALLDREASTLAILQRFSDGELVATARSLDHKQRRKILRRVHGLKSGDPDFMRYFSMGNSGTSQDVTADMIQLGADYYRMMRQVSETGHTTEDMMDTIATSRGTLVRTVAFLKATANQFATWWRAYGDVAATRAILNIDSFIEAVAPDLAPTPASKAPKLPKHEVVKVVANLQGKTIDEVLADAKQVSRIREDMRRQVLNGETPETTQLTSQELESFAKDTLGLVEGDGSSVASALATIADLPGVNPATRAIAKELSQNPDVQQLSNLLFFVGNTTDSSKARPSGFYKSASHALALNLPEISTEFAQNKKSTMWSKAWLVEVLVHEATHAATTIAIYRHEQGITQPPKVESAIKELRSLYEAVKIQDGADKFAYELSNLDEFTAAVMANPRFVSWLSGVPASAGAQIPGSKGKRSLIKRILSRIYQIVFPDLEIDSVMEKSLSRIFDIASYPHVVTKPSTKAFGGVGIYQSQSDLLGRGILIEEQIYEEERLFQYGAEGVDLQDAADEYIAEQDEIESAADEIAAYEAKVSSGTYFAPAPTLPGAVTGERKKTEALKNSLPAMPAEVRDYLKESTYLSETKAGNLDLVESLIGKSIAGATSAVEFAAIDSRIDGLGITGPQQFLARVVLGQALNKRIFDLQEAMAKAPTSGGLSLLADYEGVAKDVWRKTQNIASNSGQMLNAAAIARDLINPKIATATYRDSATDMAGKKLPEDAKALLPELQKEADKVAAEVVKKSKLTKKIVDAMAKASGGDPTEVQMMFDFMTTLENYLDESTGVPIPAKMADWVADQMLKMVDSKLKAEVKKAADKIKKASTSGSDTEATFFEEYSDEVKRLVAERINQALAAKPTTPEMTEAQKEQAKKEALRAAIGDLRSFLEYAPSVERALNQSKAKLLARLEAEKGSTPEALKLYEDAKAAIGAMSVDFVPMKKATDIVRRSFDMREQIYLSITEQQANVASLAAMITNATGLTADQSRKVAEAFKAAYEAEMNRRVQKTLTNYATRRSARDLRGKDDRYSRSERFLRLARLGGLRKEEFYNAMATEFDLPSYDPAIADELDREANRIMGMPKGSVQRNDAMQELNARIVNETYKNLLAAYGPKAIVKDAGMRAEYFAAIPVAMWKSAVLSGFGTAEVNFAFGTMQSIMDLGFNASAYAIKAKDPAFAASSLITLMRAVGWVADPAQRKEVWTEMKRAALTGRTRFGSEQSENMLVLERDIPAIDVPVIKQLMGSTKRFYKLMGRIGSVIDAAVAVPASIARQRLALHYALTTSGADQQKIAEIMSKSFSLEELESREINEILESEKEQFRNSPRPDLAMQARRFQLMEQRRAETYEQLTATLDTKDKEDFLVASRESSRFANLGTPPTGLAGLIFDGIFGTIERKTKGASSVVVSFPRAMGNILDFSLAMSFPVLSFARAKNKSPSSWFFDENNRYRREFVEKDSIQYWKLMTQGIVASVAQLTMSALYMYGLEDEAEGRVPWFMVYGKGYDDPERNRQLRYRQPRWAPYTLKIGDLYLSWKDLPGFNLLLGGLAAITDDQMKKGLKDVEKIRGWEAAANTTVAFLKAVTVKSSLQGLAQAGEIMSDSSFAEASAADNVGKLVTGFVGGGTNPRLLRDVTNIGRGIVSGGEYTLKDTRGISAAVLSMLPGNELYGESLGQRDMLNSMGTPVTNFWSAPFTKRLLPLTAGPAVDPIMSPLVSSGLFISPIKSGQMSFSTYKTGSDEVDVGGGLLSSFGPEVEADAVKMFGEQMRLRITPEYVEELTTLADKGRAERELAQKALNKVSESARGYVKDVIQARIFDREIVPHWQEK